METPAAASKWNCVSETGTIFLHVVEMKLGYGAIHLLKA